MTDTFFGIYSGIGEHYLLLKVVKPGVSVKYRTYKLDTEEIKLIVSFNQTAFSSFKDSFIYPNGIETGETQFISDITDEKGYFTFVYSMMPTIYRTNSTTIGCFDDEDSKTDLSGNNCDWYSLSSSSCGSYDDSDFTASEACCVCGGGDRVIDFTDSYNNT